jgi:hypothetical protein
MASPVAPPRLAPPQSNGVAPAGISVPAPAAVHTDVQARSRSPFRRLLAKFNEPRPGAQSAAVPVWPKTALRVGFGVIWLIDAVFKWLPDFHKGLLGMVKEAGAGQPGWLHWWFHSWVSIVQASPDFWAYGVAALETAIAFALILGFARKLTYIVTIISGLFIWGVAEGFGGPYSGTSTDIGAAVMYAVVAAALLALSQYPSSRFNVDYLLEQRIGWWHRVAELGKHNHPSTDQKETAPLTARREVVTH